MDCEFWDSLYYLSYYETTKYLTMSIHLSNILCTISVSRSRFCFVVQRACRLVDWLRFSVCLVLIQFVLMPSPLFTRYCEYADNQIKQANWFNIRHYRIVQNLCLCLQFYNQDQFNKTSIIIFVWHECTNYSQLLNNLVNIKYSLTFFLYIWETQIISPQSYVYLWILWGVTF